MKVKILSAFLMVTLLVSCDILFNSFNKEKFKGKYRIELKRMMQSSKDMDASQQFLANLAKFALSDTEIMMSFGDNNKGTLEINGMAMDFLKAFSDDLSKPMDIQYSFQSDSILMVKIGNEGYNKLGTIREYDSDYKRVMIFVDDENGGGYLVPMERI
jgi:hypothetical protein